MNCVRFLQGQLSRAFRNTEITPKKDTKQFTATKDSLNPESFAYCLWPVKKKKNIRAGVKVKLTFTTWMYEEKLTK